MSKHLQREIEKLKKQILSLSAVVEENFCKAVSSIEKRDPVIAKETLDVDVIIDQREVELEEECLKILALYQPVAADLRFIIAVLKINNDLERIGDLAVNISEWTIYHDTLDDSSIPYDFFEMAEKVRFMLKNCLDAFINLDSNLAYDVCAYDNEVDVINRRMCDVIKETIQLYPKQIDGLINFLNVFRNLERIADHATNIAEDVIYLTTGAIIRHKGKQ